MVNAHPLALVKSIVDPIHGLVRMTRVEHEVMNHRVFQRLRRIKQNGLLHLVFPSATHNRFEHSLGALFVADSVLQALLFNSAANAGKLHGDDPEDARPGEAIDLTRLPRRTTRRLFTATRLAALVHDLGHGPLSHSFDSFAPRRAAIAKLLDERPLAPLAPLREVLLDYPRAKQRTRDAPIAHEAMSCIFFAQIWHDLRAQDRALEPWMPLAVAAALLGADAREHVPTLTAVPHALRPWLTLVSDIVASAPVDADRMDYMERDSRSAGVTYGIFDRNRILKSALCYRAPDRLAFRLGWKSSGLRAIEVFVQARFQLYAQIYYHKTNSAANMMLKRIAAAAKDLPRNPLFRGVKRLEDLIATYCDLSDERFMHTLVSLERAPEIRALAERIERRDLYKRICELDVEDEDEAKRTTSRVLARLAGRDAAVRANLEPDEAKLDATKDLDDGAALLRRDAAGRYSAGRSRDERHDWLRASPILRVLKQEEQKIRRIYWTGPSTGASDRIEALKERARELADG